MEKFKNFAIIAHVDHGKTTIIDSMLNQTGQVRGDVEERAMDSNDLEKERGITIIAKCTSVKYKDYKLNIIDTPGHADFGGEVERVLSMVDGVILLVDAAEGPMPQTKFVLSKALSLGLQPIVVINKIDRSDARQDEVLDEVFDLFVALGANENQLDFKVLYASGRDGWAVYEIGDKEENLVPLFDTILEEVPTSKSDVNKPFSMLVTILDYDQYLGRILIGKIYSGKISKNAIIKSLNLDNELVEKAKVTKLLTFDGLEKRPVDEAYAGDVVAIAGFEHASVADTMCADEIVEAIESTEVDPPTMSITIGVNNSPLAGLDGDKLTSRLIKDRLLKEAASNVAIQVSESSISDSYEVAGRGELQLGVLIETLRREGFELSISRPQIVYKYEGETKLEPIEEVQIDVDQDFSGTVINGITSRGGELLKIIPSGGNKTRLLFKIPTHGLIGYFSQFLSETRGTGIMSKSFLEYAPAKIQSHKRANGVLVSMAEGTAFAYGLWNLEDRGTLCINPQDKVYVGMIIGIHNKDNDLEVNPTKNKQLTNIRTTSKDEAIRLQPPKELFIEECISFIEDDELLEVTPNHIRLRKRYLDPHERKKMKKQV